MLTRVRLFSLPFPFVRDSWICFGSGKEDEEEEAGLLGLGGPGCSVGVGGSGSLSGPPTPHSQGTRPTLSSPLLGPPFPSIFLIDARLQVLLRIAGDSLAALLSIGGGNLLPRRP
jgi:hypothetical protein